MVDNTELIKPLLKFDNEDLFYFLQILQRGKENEGLGRNSRVIKNYFISSSDYFDRVLPEVKKLCDFFNARAALRLNRRSFKNVAFQSMVNVANTLSSGEYSHVKSQYIKACGKCNSEKEKSWIIDLDGPDSAVKSPFIYSIINMCMPDGSKFMAEIPSKDGLHLITKPFNVKEFKDSGLDGIEIHKDNPTNLYIP